MVKPDPDCLKCKGSGKYLPKGQDTERIQCECVGKKINESLKPALEVQVGGGHYKDLAIQPVEYCHKNKLGFCESSAIKYITRWRSKGGLEDIDKAIHFLNMLKQMETE